MKKLISILAIVLFTLFTQGCPSNIDQEPEGYIDGYFGPIVKDDANNTYILWNNKTNLYKVTPTTLIKTDKIYSDLISLKVGEYLTYTNHINIDNTFYKREYLYSRELGKEEDFIIKDGKKILVDDLLKDYYGSKLDLNRIKQHWYNELTLYPEGLYVVMYHNDYSGVDFEDIKRSKMTSPPPQGYSKAYYRFYPVDGNGSRHTDVYLPYISEFIKKY